VRISRRLLALVLFVVALCKSAPGVLAQAPVPAPQTQPKEQTVYIRRTGKGTTGTAAATIPFLGEALAMYESMEMPFHANRTSARLRPCKRAYCRWMAGAYKIGAVKPA
jgi:hypothetical protein